MNYEGQFKKLCGKNDLLLYINIYFLGLTAIDSQYGTDPNFKATYAEVIDLVGQAKY